MGWKTNDWNLRSFPDAPSVTLKMGPNLNPNDIKEGDDVYFECHIHANPRPYKRSWFHNVSTLVEMELLK